MTKRKKRIVGGELGRSSSFSHGPGLGRGFQSAGRPARPRLYGDARRLQRVSVRGAAPILMSAGAIFKLRYMVKGAKADDVRVLRGPLPGASAKPKKRTLLAVVREVQRARTWRAVPVPAK